MSRLSSALTIGELKELARRRVPKMFFDYADSGSWTESTYRANETDFDQVLLRQRIAVDLSDRVLATDMLGQKTTMPLALAPTGLAGMQSADGEIKAARAAEKAGIPFTLSTMSICSIEDVAEATSTPFWFQLYMMRDRGFMERQVDRAKAARCSALVLTMDLQILGQRHKDLRNQLSTPPRLTPRHLMQMASRPRWCLEMLGTQRRTFRNIAGQVEGVADLRSLTAWTAGQFDPHLGWTDIGWVRDRFGGPVIVKGVLDPDDARAAFDNGADAIIISNHGGRQLDGAPSSIRVLPQIVEAVADRGEIYLDGGIYSGQSLIKAIALGARSVFAGRAFLWGLAAGGEAGVAHSIDILRKEADMTMALIGERNIADVGSHNIYSLRGLA